MDIYIQIEEFDFHILYWAKKTTKTIDLYKRKSPILSLWTNSTLCNIQTKLSNFPLKQSQQTLKSTKLKPSFRPHFGISRHEHLKFVKTTGVWPKKIIIVGPRGTDNLLHHSLGFHCLDSSEKINESTSVPYATFSKHPRMLCVLLQPALQKTPLNNQTE